MILLINLLYYFEHTKHVQAMVKYCLFYKCNPEPILNNLNLQVNVILKPNCDKDNIYCNIYIKPDNS